MSVTNVALSGLKASSMDLQVTGNNVANSGTYGFKYSRSEFDDLLYSGGANAQVGNGVAVAGTSQVFTQSSFTVTNNSFDMAIGSQGFFVLQNPSGGSSHYSRAGNFQLDSNGYITNQSGARLQGYAAVDGSITNQMTDLQIPLNGSIAPEKTSKVAFDLNLDASENAISATFDKADSATYNTVKSKQIYDSLGNAHMMEVYYVKTADNAWDAHVAIDGNVEGSGSLSFNDDGSLASSTGLDAITFNPGNGATPNQAVKVDLTSATQYGSASVVRSISADGYSVGQQDGVFIDGDGVISMVYTNGQIKPVGQVALAHFENPQGLLSEGSSMWSETSNSGRPLIDSINSTNAITAGALEDSNVDLTEQLVHLVTAQRAFQANAQSFKAGDVLSQTIINLA